MLNLNKKIVIAIDGGAATGKSSLAKSIANELNITYIDTGSMYRAVALYFLTNKININEEEVIKNLSNINIDIDYDEQNKMHVILNGVDVSCYIRTEEVSKNASIVAQIKEVRKFLIQEQRKLGSKTSVVMDGRDIGRVVFKDANVKLYITTDIDVKAKRRQKEHEKKGVYLSLEVVKKEIIDRDKRDKKNTEMAPDAIILDTTNYTVEEATTKAIEIIKTKINI